jgi:AhpD family alkylhydroperoxidase
MSTATVRYETEVPYIFELLGSVEGAIASSPLDSRLRHLVKLRVSQVNQCGYCVKMHVQEARSDGETNERLDRLVVWKQVSDFSLAEKAAFAWAEALTVIDHRTDLGAMRATLRAHFSEVEITALTAGIAMINLWNRIQISRH